MGPVDYGKPRSLFFFPKEKWHQGQKATGGAAQLQQGKANPHDFIKPTWVEQITSFYNTFKNINILDFGAPSFHLYT